MPARGRGTRSMATAAALVHDDRTRARRREELASELLTFLPRESVLTEPEELRPFECDGLTVYRRLPMIAVLPDRVEDVQRIVRVAAAQGVPVVARGAGTGLSGGALPLEDGLLLSLAKFNRILELDAERRLARVGPGVRNLAISEAADPHGLYYAPDPSSQIACSIGGNVAENSGGLHCLKYGLTVHNVLEVKVVDIEGRLLTLGGETLDAPGYDLLALITGSEGMLGIIVEVTVRLLPKQEAARVVLAAFDDLGSAGDAVAAVMASGVIPAGLEMMDSPAIRAAEDFAHCGYRPTRRPSCSARWTGRKPRPTPRSRRSGPSSSVPERASSGSRTTRPSGPGSGSAASPRSPPSGASRPTTTASTARSPASASPKS